MSVIDVSKLTYRYGRTTALRDLDLTVPTGAMYALLGPNGSGKTTLLQMLMGLRRPRAGRVSLWETPVSALTLGDREKIGYVAEGRSLPAWMRLEQLEAYLAPLYPTWDAALAARLRDQFGLDPRKKIKALSRGDYMKAALLCAVAHRPELLLMDEPFTGMDALVKDELVRGLLDFVGTEGWTVVISSHDLAELEPLADWVGFLDRGQMRLSESMETLRGRFKRVDVVLRGASSALTSALPMAWLAVEHAAHRLSFITPDFTDAFISGVLPTYVSAIERVEVRDLSLREVFVALAQESRDRTAAGALS